MDVHIVDTILGIIDNHFSGILNLINRLYILFIGELEVIYLTSELLTKHLKLFNGVLFNCQQVCWRKLSQEKLERF